MTFRALPILFAALLAPAPALSVDLFSVEGRWVGAGSLATRVERPMQPARCEVEVEQKAVGSDVSMTGRCVVGAGGSKCLDFVHQLLQLDGFRDDFRCTIPAAAPLFLRRLGAGREDSEGRAQKKRGE